MSQMPSRFDPRPFGGPYEPEDEPKFSRDLDRVRAFLIAHLGVWFTKIEIQRAAGLNDGTDVTPRLRDLRKPQYGGWDVRCKKLDGKYRYAMFLREWKFDEKEEQQDR